MNYFKEKIALITGGTSGIGQALGEALAREGALVFLAGRRFERAQETAKKLVHMGLQAQARQLDVTDQFAFEKLIQEIRQEQGRLDILVNNAGIAISGDARDLSLDHWRKVIDVNLMGVLYGTNCAYRLMANQGCGQIVNISSIAGLVEYPANSPYATTKFAVVGMSKTLRTEGQSLGVKVNLVCPGYIKTDIFQASEIINVDNGELEHAIPFRMMNVDAAAQRIIRGMKKNEAVMVFPRHARMLLFLNRFLPWLSRRISQKIIGGFRKMRKEA